MNEHFHLVTLAQVLTAMSVEALQNTDESFDLFLAEDRPHRRQMEPVWNIHGFLRGSKLIYRDHGSDQASPRQDRYSIRTASQWLGPVLKDFALAYDQVDTTLNLATESPLIQSKSQWVVHGGKLQAQCITSTMEKIRQAAQLLGQMLFMHCRELISPVTSHGLPPKL